jgi:hypothetical protein
MELPRAPSPAPDFRGLFVAHGRPYCAIAIPRGWMQAGHVNLDCPDGWLNSDRGSDGIGHRPGLWLESENPLRWVVARHTNGVGSDPVMTKVRQKGEGLGRGPILPWG